MTQADDLLRVIALVEDATDLANSAATDTDDPHITQLAAGLIQVGHAVTIVARTIAAGRTHP